MKMKTLFVWWCFVAVLLLGRDVSTAQAAECTGPQQVEIVFSFDTTGSMSSVIERVRRQVADLIDRLLSDIPTARIAVCAHGDYMDSYVVRCMDFSSESVDLQSFVLNIENTGGGDSPEAYEMVLYEMNAQNISWSACSTKSLVMIGDEEPHTADYNLNVLRVDWRTEVNKLKQKNVKIYAIRALNANNAEYFYKTMASVTGGYYLRFLTFDFIFDFMMAITYREYGLPLLLAYKEEVDSKYAALKKQTPKELSDLFETLKSKEGSSTTTVTDPYINIGKYLPPLKPYIPPPKPTSMDIYYLHVRTDIENRFATTYVTSKLANKLQVAAEAQFHIELPEAAYITNFTIERNGELFVAEVREKKEAKEIYDKAKQQGKSAGHVAAQPKSTNSFKISVNVAAANKVIFNLKYQELLERRRGLYEHRFQINPGQTVKDFKISTYISDTNEISKLLVPPVSLGNAIEANPANNDLATIKKPTTKTAEVLFSPTEEQQKKMSDSDIGAYGALSVLYDIKRSGTYGNEIEINKNGYFMQTLAPTFPAMNRKIMFVLDTSGSMSFRKMVQLKEAMYAILDQLIEGDLFNLMTFSSFFRNWKEKMQPVNINTLNDAKDFVKKMFAAGGTNIDKALKQGLDFLTNEASTNPAILVFLTDGRPTDGERNVTKIINNVRGITEANRIALYNVAFGNQANTKFLTKLAGDRGFARRVYVTFDAALQLKNFYQEISELVLIDVEIKYPTDVIIVDSVTQRQFNRYYQGSDIIVAGKIKDNVDLVTCEVIGTGKTGPVKYEVKVQINNNTAVATSTGEVSYMEKMWAYLTVKQLVRKALIAQNETEREQLNKRSLELSLQYNFVTPVTSMVVVLPENKDKDDKNDVDDLDKYGREEDDGGFLMDEDLRFAIGTEIGRGGVLAVDASGDGFVRKTPSRDYESIVPAAGSCAGLTVSRLMIAVCLVITPLMKTQHMV